MNLVNYFVLMYNSQTFSQKFHDQILDLHSSLRRESLFWKCWEDLIVWQKLDYFIPLKLVMFVWYVSSHIFPCLLRQTCCIHMFLMLYMLQWYYIPNTTSFYAVWILVLLLCLWNFSDSIFELLCKIGVCEIHGDLFLPNFMMKDEGLWINLLWWNVIFKNSLKILVCFSAVYKFLLKYGI